ncbi:MAG: hypothetical protein KAT16_10970, partial [Candidatus Heimdallarchaeota archaeon]|nr:hypothetical protein [Candidatus Heimdallarchaeota archaeon]
MKDTKEYGKTLTLVRSRMTDYLADRPSDIRYKTDNNNVSSELMPHFFCTIVLKSFIKRKVMRSIKVIILLIFSNFFVQYIDAQGLPGDQEGDIKIASLSFIPKKWD